MTGKFSINLLIERFKNAKDNSDILEAIIDIYFLLRFNSDVQEEFQKLIKYRPFEDTYFVNVDDCICLISKEQYDQMK